MKLWRVVQQRHLAAALRPPRMAHRWSSERSRITYASCEPGLAVLEKLVEVRDVGHLAGYLLVEIEFAGSTLEATALPEGWDSYPHPLATQQVGDAWAASKVSGALRVPSVLLPAQNVLLDQEHEEFDRATVVATHALDKFVR